MKLVSKWEWESKHQHLHVYQDSTQQQDSVRIDYQTSDHKL